MCFCFPLGCGATLQLEGATTTSISLVLSEVSIRCNARNDRFCPPWLQLSLPGRRLSAGLRRRSLSAASANSRTCVIKRTCGSYGDRCFAAAGPRLRNKLAAHLRQTDIKSEQVKRLLKTFSFEC